MKRFLIGVVVALLGVYAFTVLSKSKKEHSILQENTMLIQEQIRKVSTLVVTKGHFAEVYTYKDSQELFGPLVTADKKALVVVNAEVTVGYDLSALVFKIEEETKTLFLQHIPEPEITINPDFEYYDVTADYLNPFKAKDYNTIKKNVKASLLKKVEASTLKSNAKNRLLSELSKFYTLTNSLGWTLQYNQQNLKVNSLKEILLE